MNLHQRLTHLEHVIKPNKGRISPIFVKWARGLDYQPDPADEAGILMISNERGDGMDSYHLTNEQYAEYDKSGLEPDDWIKTTNIQAGGLNCEH